MVSKLALTDNALDDHKQLKYIKKVYAFSSEFILNSHYNPGLIYIQFHSSRFLIYVGHVFTQTILIFLIYYSFETFLYDDLKSSVSNLTTFGLVFKMGVGPFALAALLSKLTSESPNLPIYALKHHVITLNTAWIALQQAQQDPSDFQAMQDQSGDKAAIEHRADALKGHLSTLMRAQGFFVIMHFNLFLILFFLIPYLLKLYFQAF
ncbi:hypothetical protein ACJX0J_039488, partial [Zea mays]